MSVTSVRLQPEVEQQLDAMAGEQHRSKSWLINQALREFVARQRLEQQRWKDTLVALEDVRDGRVVAGASVHAWLQGWSGKGETKAPKVKR
jgi:predicted transcriptional regulator